MLVEPDQVLAICASSTDPQIIAEVLVRWKGLLKFEASWESTEIIRNHFPYFNLEDKVGLLQGGIDERPPIRFTYKRRGHANKDPTGQPSGI